MNFRTGAFPYSLTPASFGCFPLSLRERGLKTQPFAFHPFSLLNFVHTEKGRGMRAKNA
jgi:hypothetical protein